MSKNLQKWGKPVYSYVSMSVDIGDQNKFF